MDLTALIRAFVAAGLAPGLYSAADTAARRDSHRAGDCGFLRSLRPKFADSFALRPQTPALLSETADDSSSAPPLTDAEIAGPVPRLWTILGDSLE